MSAPPPAGMEEEYEEEYDEQDLQDARLPQRTARPEPGRVASLQDDEEDYYVPAQQVPAAAAAAGEGDYEDEEDYEYEEEGPQAPATLGGMTAGFGTYASAPYTGPKKVQEAAATPATEKYAPQRPSGTQQASYGYAYDDDGYDDQEPQVYHLEGKVYRKTVSPAQTGGAAVDATVRSPKRTTAVASSPATATAQPATPTTATAPPPPPRQASPQQSYPLQPGATASPAPAPVAAAAPTPVSGPSRPRMRAHKTQAGTPFQGDISAWGKTEVDIYEDMRSDVASTLSSGLSPRGEGAADRAPLDIQGAKRALAYQSGLYGHANALRRAGMVPASMMGVSDDLPNRMAYQQLNALAGMASKVQDAIEHNKKIFEARMRAKDKEVMRQAFDAWRTARYGTVRELNLVKKCVARIARGCMARCFYAWKETFHLVDKHYAMRKKVQATLLRGLMKRAFDEWRRLAHERWWKNQYVMREDQVQVLNRQLEAYQKRPIYVIRNRRLRAILRGWWLLRFDRGNKKRAWKKWRNIMLTKAWNSWMYHMERRRLLYRAVKRVMHVKMSAAWNTWRAAIAEKRIREGRLRKAALAWRNSTLAKAWNSWTSYIAWRREKKQIIQRWKQPMLYKAFAGWQERAAWKKRMRIIVQRAAVKIAKRRLTMAWERLCEVVEESKHEKSMTTKEDLMGVVKNLEAENERLRRDNERFVRLIDSGEWGRGRVAELVGAGEVLKGERDALLNLIKSLRREYEAVEKAKNGQEEELRQLKERMMLGGAARNRMLIKGGSSFNALVRAMKQDLVEGPKHPAGRDPNLMYEVDKLSMDRVNVFPDGELNIQAMASGPTSAIYSQGINVGSPGPVQAMRVPGGLAHIGSGGQRSGSPGALARPPPLPPAASAAAAAAQRVAQTLSSLSPAEVDRLDAALRAESAAAQQRQAGLAVPVVPAQRR